MPPILRYPALIAVALAMATPITAAPPRGFTCTNIMGGNPFRLTISENLVYIVASFPESYQRTAGEGQLERAEIGSYYTVVSGPLLDELGIGTIHIMSPTALTPSGSNGLFDCTKAK